MLHISNNSNSLYMGEEPSTENKYYGKVYYKTGESYQGYFLNNNYHGYGEERTQDGFTKGFYNNGKLNGKAITYQKSKGNFIDGYYVDGKLNGECLFFDEKGNLVNKGMYKDGKSCVASYEIINQNIDGKTVKVYEGYVFDDKYNGFGKLYENDRIYIGNFTTGKKDGKFLVCYKDGSLVYSPQTNVELIVDLDKINKDNFFNYKNCITFNNDLYDDSHKIVYKENNVVKYIGKFNSELKYHDDSGTFYVNNSTYSGKFQDGKFISGTYTFPGGKYKGEFNGLLMNGQGTIEFDNGNKFVGNFENNKSDLGTLTFKCNNNESIIKCKIIFNETGVVIDTLPNTEFQLNSQNKYVGDFFLQSTNNGIKIDFANGKHYENNILVYEGQFKFFKYHGDGIKYHPNGFIQISGKFEENEPYKAEYYDDSGNLIYSDQGIDDDYGINTPIAGLNNQNIVNTVMNLISNALHQTTTNTQNNTNTPDVDDDTLSDDDEVDDNNDY